MAITNAQQYKQLLAKGGRIGLQGGGKDMGTVSTPDRPARDDKAINERMQNIGKDSSVSIPLPKPPKTKNNSGGNNIETLLNFVPGVGTIKNLGKFLRGTKLQKLNNSLQRQNYFRTLSPEEQVEALQDLAKIGIGTDSPMGIDRNITRGMEDDGFFGTGIGGGKFITDIDFGGPEAKAVLGKGYTDYQKEQRERFTPDDRDGPQDPCKGPNPPAYCFTGIRSAEPEVEEEDDEIINYRLMADGGRAAFKGGGADMGAPERAQERADRGYGDTSGVQDKSNAVQTANNNAAIMMARMQNKKLNQITNPNFIEKFPSGIRAIDKMNLDKMLANMNLNNITEDDDDDTNAINTVFSPTIASDVQTVFGTGLDNRRQKEKNILDEMADGGRAGLAEGGMPYEGGIMDLETSRQQYGLGKLVKKITRSVKKVAKSPIGKAALAFGAYKLGGGLFKNDAFKNFMFKNGVPGLSTLTNKGIFAGIGGISALAGLMTPKEDDDEELYAGADIADPRYIMNNPELFTNRRLAAEGGSMDEPVAKKTMPLLDMDGQEMDLRAEGGFVPLGRMEKADDVPARLSKNEFVFTADAVRNAGEGDVDKGAEVMYNMMKNLESGGDVSEESQGLEGARDMFQTSQRLEEVI